MAETDTEVVAAFLEKARPEHRDLLAGLHELLIEIEPAFSISLKWGNPAYSINGQTFTYLADQADYVHLGFYNGAQFEDPHGLVEGTGKRLRHIKVSEMTDDLRVKLADVIRASLTAGSEY